MDITRNIRERANSTCEKCIRSRTLILLSTDLETVLSTELRNDDDAERIRYWHIVSLIYIFL